MTALDKAKKVAGAAITIGAVWKVLGGSVQKAEDGVIQKVTLLGMDVFDRRRMEARRARRRARRG